MELYSKQRGKDKPWKDDVIDYFTSPKYAANPCLFLSFVVGQPFPTFIAACLLNVVSRKLSLRLEFSTETLICI